MCPAVKRDLKSSIDNDQVLRKGLDMRGKEERRGQHQDEMGNLGNGHLTDQKGEPGTPKTTGPDPNSPSMHRLLLMASTVVLFFLTLQFMLARPADSPPRILPVSLEPLLMTIQDECYTLEKEVCICGLQLSNSEIARLEVTWLWALCTGNCGNLGWAHVLTPIRKLPYEELLVAESAQSSSHELKLDGHYLECSGALALLRPIADYMERQGKDQLAPASPDAVNPPPRLQGLLVTLPSGQSQAQWLSADDNQRAHMP
ncbi:hypothetical protein P7K49_031692 [Saguinus oedipus]|uniref:Uncharacterized protein n=1 Tax=Saguinus oedipus TaxID=9490 RepID=A0ABQ9U053_SAGOE|nr:hypothetical protein P7K49_031692 [Saguinus oedipus]